MSVNAEEPFQHLSREIGLPIRLSAGVVDVGGGRVDQADGCWEGKKSEEYYLCEPDLEIRAPLGMNNISHWL